MPVSVSFGTLEAMLAALHGIASEKRTQFQGRLRKFQRLGIPAGVGSGRGVAARYSGAQLFETALALQFTELGITPERLSHILRMNTREIGVAVRHAAQSVRDNPNVSAADDRDEQLTHMFVYFDPNALRTLTSQVEQDWDWAAATLFRAGAADLRKNLVSLSRETTRLALINVTVLVGDLASGASEKERDALLAELIAWSHQLEEMRAPPMRRLTAEETADEVENQREASSAHEGFRQQIAALSPDAAYTLRWVAAGTEMTPNGEAAQELIDAGMLKEGDEDSLVVTDLGQQIGNAIQTAAVLRGWENGDSQ